MKATEAKLLSFLQKSPQFVIPIYQRTYSWTNKQCQQLWDDVLNVEFLGELFRSRNVCAKFRAESKGLGTGTSGFLRLYNDRLGAIHLALPPHSEQRDILAGLEEELSAVHTANARLEREIELLREYRTRLVADVVTGKLDVRELALRLPDEAPPEIVEDVAGLNADSDAGDEGAAL